MGISNQNLIAAVKNNSTTESVRFLKKPLVKLRQWFCKIGQKLCDIIRMRKTTQTTVEVLPVTTEIAITKPILLKAKNCVLKVCNINTNKLSLDDIFVLLGIYGNVIRIRVIGGKPPCALVQMSDPFHAQLVIKYLNGFTVYEKKLDIQPVEEDTVKLPTDPHSPDLAKDYFFSSLHRYTSARSNYVYHANPPTNVLHLSNMTPDVTEHQVMCTFEDHGFKIKKLKLKHNSNPKIGLVMFGNVEEALTALIKMHDFYLGRRHLRLSFAKQEAALLFDHTDITQIAVPDMY